MREADGSSPFFIACQVLSYDSPPLPFLDLTVAIGIIHRDCSCKPRPVHCLSSTFPLPVLDIGRGLQLQSPWTIPNAAVS